MVAVPVSPKQLIQSLQELMTSKHINCAAKTSGKQLTRNAMWNLLGSGLPLLVGLIAIPPLIHGLGTEGFGILSIAWLIIGYFSLFDLGLGRALTQVVAEKVGAEQLDSIPALTWTALILMVVLGIIGGLVMAELSPWIVQRALKISAHLQYDTLRSFYMLALSIPIVISTAGLRGILEAYQRFDLVNAIRIPMGLFTFLGPLLILPFSKNLFPIVTLLIIGRAVVWVAHLVLCLRVVPALRYNVRVDRTLIKPLLHIGGWMTVSNIIGPLMVYFDRFLIGAVVSVAAVAYYATPYEIVTKLWIVPSALAGVLFPAFSAALIQDRAYAVRLLERSVNHVFLILFPLSLVIVTFAYEGLHLWVGREFAANSSFVLKWLSVGVFINSLAHTPFAMVQGAGRSDLSAKTHIIELPFYLLALWWLLSIYGIQGAAVAWVVRVSVDTAVFFFMVRRLLPEASEAINRITVMLICAVGILLVAGFLNGLLAKGFFLVTVLTALVLYSQHRILEPAERELIKRVFRLQSA